MQHGFKAYANRLALSIRSELELSSRDELSCVRLAEKLGIKILEFSKLKDVMDNDSWVQLTVIDSSAFSAMTIFYGSIRVIIVNNFHHPNRQKSSLAHELAHALLLHQPLPVHSLDGSNHRDSEQEQEAAYLSGALLLPNEACMQVVRESVKLDIAASNFGVSKDFLEYRLRISGAYQRHRREQKSKFNHY